MTSISYKWCRTLELDSETFITTREGGEFKSRDCVVGFWLVVVEECVYVCVCVRERLRLRLCVIKKITDYMGKFNWSRLMLLEYSA